MNIQITDQDLVQQIEQLAVAEHCSPKQIVAEALRLYTSQTQKLSGVAFCFRLPSRDILARPIFLNGMKQSWPQKSTRFEAGTRSHMRKILLDTSLE